MTIYLLLVWHRQHDKVLNVFFYDTFDAAARMGAEFDADPAPDGDIRTICTVVEGRVV